MPKKHKQNKKSKQSKKQRTKSPQEQQNPKQKQKHNKHETDYESKISKKEQRRRKRQKEAEIEQEFKDELHKLGYYIKEVAGDGNCLFRSVSDQIEDNENNHRAYRIKTTEYMKANIEKFKPFVDSDEIEIEDYIAKMEKNREWGGNLEIYAMSMALKVNFYIYIYQRPLYVVKNWDNPVQNIMMTFHDGQHYNSLRKIEDGKMEENEKAKEKKKKEKEKESDEEGNESEEGSDNDNNSDDDDSEDNAKVNNVKTLIEKVKMLNI